MFDIRMQRILDDLRADLDADRCTLRLDVPGETFPVVHESRGPGVGTLIGERTVVIQYEVLPAQADAQYPIAELNPT